MTAPARQPKKTIRQLRQERGWSQADVAGRLRLTTSTVANWESGHRVPTAHNLQRLAALFGVPVEAIAVGPPAQPPQDRP